MTPQEKQAKKDAKKAFKEQQKQDKKEAQTIARSWNDFIKRMTKKGALITEN